MEILHIYLKYFKPLYLANINEFDYTIGEAIQLILGTNGCGKSSLLRVLAPHAPDSKEFGKGGCKKITIRANGSEYLLVSKFHPTHHSFLKDGVELNDGGTMSVFNSLVEREFNYDKNIHKLLTGKLGFSEMNANQRRELIYRVSGLDLTYVTDLFKKATGEHRDTLGAIKFAASTLEDIASKMVTKEEHEEMERELQELINYQTGLREHYGAINASSNTVVTQMHQVLDKLVTVKTQMAPLLKRKLLNKGMTKAEMRTELDGLMSKEGSCQNELDRQLQRLTKLSEIMTKFDGVDTETALGGLHDRRIEISEQMDLYASATKPESYYPDGHAWLKRMQMAWNNVLSSGYPQSTISYHDHLLAKEEVDNFRNVQADAIRNRDLLKARVEQAELTIASAVVCNKCNHTILPEFAVGNEALTKMRTDLGLFNKRVGELEEQASTSIAVRNKDFTDYILASNMAVGFVEENGYTIEQNSILRCVPLRDIVANPVGYGDKLRSIGQQMLDWEQKTALEAEIKEIDDTIGVYSLFGEGEVSDTAIELAQTKYDEMMDEQCKIKETIDAYKQTLSEIDLMVSYHADAKTLYAEYRTLCKEFISTCKNELVAKEAAEVIIRVNSLTERLNAVRSTTSRVKDMRQRLVQLEDDRDAYALLVKCLSPRTGLIASISAQTLEKFTQDVNDVIDKVWDYDLIVKPYKDKTDIRYKLPLICPNNSVDDIAEGSEGQVDIIDLAVTINVMRYTGLEGYPLFLDEVGRSFDHTHRANFIRYVKELSTSGICGQIFMINHFSSEYGGISNADTVVISSDNIVTPVKYNEHVMLA